MGIDEAREDQAVARVEYISWLTDFEQLLRRSHQPVVLGDRKHESEGIDLLERIGTDHGARHLSGDGDQGHRVELRIGDCGDQITGSGSTNSWAPLQVRGPGSSVLAILLIFVISRFVSSGQKKTLRLAPKGFQIQLQATATASCLPRLLRIPVPGPPLRRAVPGCLLA